MVNVWVALVEVCSLPDRDVLNGALGAYVNIVAFAHNERELNDVIFSSMNECGLDVICIENARDITQSDDESQEITELVKQLTEETPILFDDFQTFKE